MPYRVRKPYLIINGQKLVSPTAVPKRLPFCDTCDELAVRSENRYIEIAPSKWWKWFWYPQFSCEQEAYMGCKDHPVRPHIRFLDGRVEEFSQFPLTRWEKLTEPYAVVLAIIFAVVFAVVIEVIKTVAAK